MRRFSAAILAALLAVGLFAPASFAASPGTSSQKAVPKVVLIVGPSGASSTSRNRAQARAAAALARKYTPDVVELYSPKATWPAVKDALQGASLVVYMGHGNGWPSKYRDELYPPSQNGFGLNPKPGGNDSTHQYFGEGIVGTQVKLAKNAVVLLNHLCYASGNSEPGLPEGTLDQARQRVDNYAAGFIKAGASAVIAEAYQSPSYFVKAVLGGGRSIQSAWQSSPSANGHRLAFESARSAGYVAQMDTETASSGFTRSIVMKAKLTPKDVLAGAAGSRTNTSSPSSAAAAPAIDLEPTLAGTGIKLGAPAFAALPSVGSKTNLDIPFKIKDRKQLPKGLQASVRWDPIDVSIVPADPAAEVAEAAPAESAPTEAAPTQEVVPAAEAEAGAAPATANAEQAPVAATAPVTAAPPAEISAALPAEGDPAPGPKTVTANGPTTAAAVVAKPVPEVSPVIEAPTDAIELVVPEQIGDVVSPAKVKIAKKALRVPVAMPTAPGRYRLTVTLHDADGVAYDDVSQAMVPSLIVRVTGDFDGAIQAASAADLKAGANVNVGVRVVNLGVAAWGIAAIKPTSNLSGYVPAKKATVTGRWIPLSIDAVLPVDPAAQLVSADLPIGLEPGKTFDAKLAVKAPTVPGSYLLLLDVVTPDHGSLVASGANPTLIRVTVAPAVAP